MSTPVTVHQLSADGGRRFFVRSSCETHILGIAPATSTSASSSCCPVPEIECPLFGLSLAALNA
ncbi:MULTISPECIES: hypothetical protein [unclassified Streptomyces]|uniref:hypothetical protein n=1 Tax=unclassified Streptomyces TaxID=2593676 RepID=UPI0033B62097